MGQRLYGFYVGTCIVVLMALAFIAMCVYLPEEPEALWEIDLRSPNYLSNLEVEPDVEVLGKVKSTPRYGSAVSFGWGNGRWEEPCWMDNTLEDRYIIKCTLEKAVELSRCEWVKKVGDAMNGTVYDGQTVAEPTEAVEELPPWEWQWILWSSPP